VSEAEDPAVTRPHARTFGLYSAFRACMAIVLRSRAIPRLQVATMFLLGTTVQAVSRLIPFASRARRCVGSIRTARWAAALSPRVSRSQGGFRSRPTRRYWTQPRLPCCESAD